MGWEYKECVGGWLPKRARRGWNRPSESTENAVVAVQWSGGLEDDARSTATAPPKGTTTMDPKEGVLSLAS